MDGLLRILLSCLLVGASACCGAVDSEDTFTREVLDAHVRAQFQQFGPLSQQHEYFGYVYFYGGVLASAVIRGRKCVSPRICAVETSAAARLIPRGARVLGEWHTHPHRGSGQLSNEDVRGAHYNIHIPGYTAYYSMPNGDIYVWDPQTDRVQTAMASRVLIGNYRTRTVVTVQTGQRPAQRR